MSEITEDREDGVHDGEVPEAVESVEATETANSVQTVETTEVAEAAETEAAEPVEVAEPPAVAETAEVAEATEAEGTESVEATETPEVADVAEVTKALVTEPVAPETVENSLEPVEDTAEVAAAVAAEPAADDVTTEVPADVASTVASEVVPEPDPTEFLAPGPVPGSSTPEPWAASLPMLTALPEPDSSTLRKPRKKFPWRWAGAVVTMLAVGAGCAFAVMAPQRTQLPGLKTASDGRYTFAPLVLPTLAPGQSDPNSSANLGEQHISDIRKLLLPAPKGAVLDHSLPGATGWVSKAATLALLDNSMAAEQLNTDGWRHTAGVAWKTPDGAETKIWLMQFIDSSAESDAGAAFSTFGGGSLEATQTIAIAYDSTASYVRVVKGSTASWYGQVSVDDAELLLEFTAPVSVGITPFKQELDLQTELLQ